jgi:hypothetical protein
MYNAYNHWLSGLTGACRTNLQVGNDLYGDNYLDFEKIRLIIREESLYS